MLLHGRCVRIALFLTGVLLIAFLWLHQNKVMELYKATEQSLIRVHIRIREQIQDVAPSQATEQSQVTQQSAVNESSTTNATCTTSPNHNAIRQLPWIMAHTGNKVSLDFKYFIYISLAFVLLTWLILYSTKTPLYPNQYSLNSCHLYISCGAKKRIRGSAY